MGYEVLGIGYAFDLYPFLIYLLLFDFYQFSSPGNLYTFMPSDSYPDLIENNPVYLIVISRPSL